MKDERRREMMKTEEGRAALRTEMLEVMKNCIDDLIELNHRGAVGASVALVELEGAESALLDMVGESDPGGLLDEIRRLTSASTR